MNVNNDKQIYYNIQAEGGDPDNDNLALNDDG